MTKSEKPGSVPGEAKEPDTLTDQDLDKVNGGAENLLGDDIGILRGGKTVDQVSTMDLGSGRAK